MFRLNDSTKGDNGHLSGSTTPAVQEDGYWEALMRQGEVAALVEPPPWATNGHSSAPCQDDYGQDDDQNDWKRAECLLEQKECCHLAVVGFNRGGLLVQFGGLTGFVPSSHLVDFPGVVDPIEREDALKRRLGEALKLQVIEIDRPQARLILSERIAREAERGESLFARINAGDILTGRVSNLRRFGAFVDLGGYEGLIHISELSWGRVNYPGDVVRPGDTVQVYVLDVDPAERKIQLSLKHLQSDPWRDVAQRFRAGQVVRGEVTNVVSFGAFVRLGRIRQPPHRPEPAPGAQAPARRLAGRRWHRRTGLVDAVPLRSRCFRKKLSPHAVQLFSPQRRRGVGLPPALPAPLFCSGAEL